MKRVITLKDGDVVRFVYDNDTDLLKIYASDSEDPLIQAKMSVEERLRLAQVLADPTGFNTPLVR